MKKIYEINETDKYYPKNLLKLRKHPKKLYAMGNPKILNNKSVAMVGSRNHTSYGEYYASNFSKILSKAGITVVSGLAIGIDSICHKNAMKEKGKTIAVIGSGFNNMYPHENIELSKQIIENGGVIVSEYPPEKEIDLANFPIRNRIISGLSECTIVIEAKYRSGSAITARHAFEQDKNVFCIPGRIGDKTAIGTNNLIKKGAKLVTNVNEILIELGEETIDIPKTNKNIKEQKNEKTRLKKEGKENRKARQKIEKQYENIYKLLQKSQMDINEIARVLKMNISDLNIKLTMMEIEGFIEVLPGNIIKIK